MVGGTEIYDKITNEIVDKSMYFEISNDMILWCFTYEQSFDVMYQSFFCSSLILNLLICAIPKIVSYASSMASSDLPVMTRCQREGRVSGKVAQAFHVPSTPVGMAIPGWIASQWRFPPNGIKDAENVGFCSQVFFVSKYQPNSFKLG